MSALCGDVKFATRQLVRQPVYALTIVFLMALGIAGNAAGVPPAEAGVGRR